METDKETDRKTMRETDRGDGLGNRLGDRPGDRPGDFKRFFEGVFESGALPVTGGRGGHWLGHHSPSSVPLKPLFFKRSGDTGLPFSSERHKNLSYLRFS